MIAIKYVLFTLLLFIINVSAFLNPLGEKKYSIRIEYKIVALLLL